MARVLPPKQRSAILFCLYLRDVLAAVSVRAEVQVDGFFDDINVSGEPAEVMKAFAALQQLLPDVRLTFNTSKSSFAYLYDAHAPLMRSVRSTLAEHNIHVHHDWLGAVGAVIGRDEHAIREGVAATLAVDEGSTAFFRRLQLDTLSVQSAMIILRQCGVPKMNYALRCMPPSCIAQQATAFDELVITTAHTKLLLHRDEALRQPVLERLRAPLRHGSFGLTSARDTSPAAFLGSMAAVAAAPAFAAYSQPDCPLPSSTLLHGWIEDCMRTVVDAALASGSAATIGCHLLPALRPSCGLHHHHCRHQQTHLRPHPPARAQLAVRYIHVQGLPAAREGDEEGGWRQSAGSPGVRVDTTSVGMEERTTDER